MFLYSLFERLSPLDITVDEVYETAINSVHPDRHDYSQLWIDYILMLIMKASSTQSLKVGGSMYNSYEYL